MLDKLQCLQAQKQMRINSTLETKRKACMSLHNIQSSDPEDGHIGQNMWHPQNKVQFCSITCVTCWLRYQLSMPFLFLT